MLSGNLMRQATHYETFTSVGPVSDAHSQQSAGRGIFEPVPEATVPANAGDIFAPRDTTPHTAATLPPIDHGASSMAAPVGSGVDPERGDNTATARMVSAHARVDYTLEQYAPNPDPTKGRLISWVDGRRPQDPSMDAFLVGNNGYDRSNPTSDVYGGDRYRTGVWTPYFGTYEFPTKQDQDAMVRPVVYPTPAFAVDKPNIQNPAPYSTPSSGTERFVLPSFQDPRMFMTPSETGMSDYVMAQQGTPGPSSSDFLNNGRL